MEHESGTKIRKVVCIDNDPMIVDLLKLILNTHGFEGLGAESGPEGLALIPTEKPDVVLLDLLMPEMNGWQVYKCMKDDEYMQTIPVIIVTALTESIDETLARSLAKVDDYIKKPFSPGDLVKSIHKVLGDPDAALTP